MKSLSKTKPKSAVKKGLSFNYSEIEYVIKSVCNGVLYENLTFLDQCFISFIVVMYSLFARYEEVRELKNCYVYLIGHDFSRWDASVTGWFQHSRLACMTLPGSFPFIKIQF